MKINMNNACTAPAVTGYSQLRPFSASAGSCAGEIRLPEERLLGLLGLLATLNIRNFSST
jgi:hypothetical protein